MAETLEVFAAPHGNRIYPWESWTDGKTWQITKGIDFDVEARIMQGQVKVRASKEGRKTRTRLVGDSVVFTFQRPGEAIEDFEARTKAAPVSES